MTNNHRIDKIEERIGYYQYEEGYAPDLEEEDQLEDVQTSLGDALCDLMHWCALNKVDFDTLVERGRMHFEAEDGCKQCKRERKTGKEIDEDKHNCAVA